MPGKKIRFYLMEDAFKDIRVENYVTRLHFKKIVFTEYGKWYLIVKSEVGGPGWNIWLYANWVRWAGQCRWGEGDDLKCIKVVKLTEQDNQICVGCIGEGIKWWPPVSCLMMQWVVVLVTEMHKNRVREDLVSLSLMCVCCFMCI